MKEFIARITWATPSDQALGCFILSPKQHYEIDSIIFPLLCREENGLSWNNPLKVTQITSSRITFKLRHYADLSPEGLLKGS